MLDPRTALAKRPLAVRSVRSLDRYVLMKVELDLQETALTISGIDTPLTAAHDED